MELYAATVIYEDDGKLTVYDKTQGVQNVQRYLCGVFGMKPEECTCDVAVRGRRHSVWDCVRSSRWCWRCSQRARCAAPCVWF